MWPIISFKVILCTLGPKCDVRMWRLTMCVGPEVETEVVHQLHMGPQCPHQLPIRQNSHRDSYSSSFRGAKYVAWSNSSLNNVFPHNWVPEFFRGKNWMRTIWDAAASEDRTLWGVWGAWPAVNNGPLTRLDPTEARLNTWKTAVCARTVCPKSTSKNEWRGLHRCEAGRRT